MTGILLLLAVVVIALEELRAGRFRRELRALRRVGTAVHWKDRAEHLGAEAADLRRRVHDQRLGLDQLWREVDRLNAERAAGDE